MVMRSGACAAFSLGSANVLYGTFATFRAGSRHVPLNIHNAVCHSPGMCGYIVTNICTSKFMTTLLLVTDMFFPVGYEQVLCVGRNVGGVASGYCL